jgi:cysteine desulfurase
VPSLMRLYADYNATGLLRPAASAAMAQALKVGGNASSVHREGRAAKALLEGARDNVAQALGALTENIVFTSGATEALHLAMAAPAHEACSLIVSDLEHDAIHAEAFGRPHAAHAIGPVFRLGATPDGLIDLADLEALLAQAPRPALVAVMAANNETGVIQPVAQAARLARAAGALLLVDATQAPGRMAVDLQALDATYLVASSHKVGGPPGAGVLALAPGAPFIAAHLGGGQERGRRAGTENIPSIVGFAAALEISQASWPSEAARLQGLRDLFEAALRSAQPDAEIFGAKAARLCNTSCFALPGLRAETALIALDLQGVAVSSGAACSSGKVRPSRVLQAMGAAPALAASALRVSFGWDSAPSDPQRLVDALSRVRLKAQPRMKEGAA